MLTKSLLTRAKNRLVKFSGDIPEGAIGITKDGKFLFQKDTIVEEIIPRLQKLSDFNFDENLFIPMRSGDAMDGIFSKDGGIMPATNYIIIGDPYAGKTTTSIIYASKIKQTGKKVLFVSAEMSPIDLIVYSKSFPIINDLDTLFLSEEFARCDEYDVWKALEYLFAQDYDLIVVDSLAEVAASVKEQRGWSSVLVEKKFVDLMIKANTKSRTSFIIIQQVTKGGKFVGSNKLKHNTTGMIEIRFDKSGKKSFKVAKNRRGFIYDNLYFTLQDGCLEFDTERAEFEKNAEMFVTNSQNYIKKESDEFFDSLKLDEDENNGEFMENSLLLIED